MRTFYWAKSAFVFFALSLSATLTSCLSGGGNGDTDGSVSSSEAVVNGSALKSPSGPKGLSNSANPDADQNGMNLIDEVGSDWPIPFEEGWTNLSPSADSRLVYVSSSSGNDANSGLSEAAAKRTIAAAKLLLRNGYPDWILLKRGDVFYESYGALNWGRSASERHVITAYGNTSASRPRVAPNPGNSGISAIQDRDYNYIAVIGIHFEPNNRLNTQSGGVGFHLLGRSKHILIEDCVFSSFAMNLVLQGYFGEQFDTTLRRSLVVDAWGIEGSGHSSGIFSDHNTRLTLEHVIFDHNGWKVNTDSSKATMFNHNIYIEHQHDLVVRNNLFTRGASMGIKLRSDVTNGATELLIQNNFFFDGEIGLGIGGNTTEPRRFVGVEVTDNVFFAIGKSNNTARNFAWGIEIQDNVDAHFKKNLVLNMPEYSNSFAFRMFSGTNENVTLEENVVYNIRGLPFQFTPTAAWNADLVSKNTIYNTSGSNQYYSINPDNGRVQFRDNAVVPNLYFNDPSRSLTSYMASLNQVASEAQFLNLLRLQRRGAWQTNLNAESLNQYFRVGFSKKP